MPLGRHPIENGQGIAGPPRTFLHSVHRLLTRCVLFLANDSRERHSAVTALVRRLCSLLRPFATSAVQCDSESHRCSSQFPRSCIPCIFNSTAVTCHPLVHPAGPRSEPRRAVGRSGGVEGFRATLADWTGKHLCPQNESRYGFRHQFRRQARYKWKEEAGTQVAQGMGECSAT